MTADKRVQVPSATPPPVALLVIAEYRPDEPKVDRPRRPRGITMANCQGTTAKGRPCRSGAMPFSPYCGPHHNQALRKAREAFDHLDHPSAHVYSQLLTDMESGIIEVVEIDFDWLRVEWQRLKSSQGG